MVGILKNKTDDTLAGIRHHAKWRLDDKIKIFKGSTETQKIVKGVIPIEQAIFLFKGWWMQCMHAGVYQSLLFYISVCVREREREREREIKKKKVLSLTITYNPNIPKFGRTKSQEEWHHWK